MDAVMPLPADADRAFEDAVHAESPALGALARRMLGADAEDALQEAWIRAWNHRTDLRDPAARRAWLRQVVVRECLRTLRWRALRRVLPFFAVPEVPTERDPGAGIDLQRVACHVERLPPQQRMMWGLRFDEGWTVPEIAVSMGLSPETVKTQLGRALARIQAEVRDV